MFIVKDSADQPVSARVGGRWMVFGSYRRVAVLEIDPSTCPPEGPRMISDRARGVVRVVETWERLYSGRTERCAFSRAMREAQALADRLNAEAR